MATDTILPENTQQFVDDEIVDNFGAPDDGVPMGLGGEKGKQSEPASSTLEADMLQPKPKQEEKPPSDDAVPSDDAAASGEPEPVQDAARDDGKAPEEKAEPQTDEPESPEFPDALLRMAGFSTAEEAEKFGFKDPEALLAAVQLRDRQRVSPAKLSRPSYLESETPTPQPTTTPAETPPTGDGTFKRFKPTNPDIFDEELLKLLDEQDKHYATQFEQLASRLKSQDEGTQLQRELNEAAQFDKALQDLGPEWEAEFGKGDGDVLFGKTDVESIAAANGRIKMFDTFKRLRKASEDYGETPLDLKTGVQRALAQRYPDKHKQQLLRERQTKAQARRNTQASRPTARKTPLGTKDARILSALQGKYPGVDFSHGDSDLVGDI